MKAVFPSTMKLMDKTSIEQYKIPGIVLMENAGRAIAEIVKNKLPRENKSPARISIFCGKGNNGGDGFVAARHLANMGFEVVIFITSNPGSITKDAATNLEIIKNMGLRIKVIAEDTDLDNVKTVAKESSIIIDAMLGTGLKGDVRGTTRELIRLINSLGIPIVAVDIPSGICGRSGKVLGTAVKAKYTVTMGLPKIGLLLYPGAEYVGKLYTADIGMPLELIKSIEAEAQVLDCKWAAKCFRTYPPFAHKGDFGKVFIIAGSTGMTGAAALSAMAAVRSGAGLVTVGIPKSLNDVLEVKLTEAMTLPLPEGNNGSICFEALNHALTFASKCDAVVLGPGLSTNDDTKQFVRGFVKACPVPIVIDADGLNAVAECPSILKEVKSSVVITPHPGEMARLLSVSVSDIQLDRVNAVKKSAKEFNCVSVLKGARTLVADIKEGLLINTTGNAGMATGGSGDVLAGIIGAFIARGMRPYEAAGAGVFLHGLAGDFASNEMGEISLAATDLIKYLPKAINEAVNDTMEAYCKI